MDFWEDCLTQWEGEREVRDERQRREERGERRDSRFKKLYYPFKNILKTEIFI